jgi:hypothetical protein
MAKNLKNGETVFVPTSLLPDPSIYGTALIRRKITSTSKRSATVELSEDEGACSIASSKLHRNLGVLILKIGDLETEAVLLDPLAKSILQFSRLFMDDSFVHLLQVRSVAEIEAWLPSNAARFSHLVLVSHCDSHGLKFGVGGTVAPTDLAGIVGLPSNHRMTFVSLACESGRASFSKEFSQLPFCEALLAPYHPVHGVIASQFCQSFFSHLFILGESLKIAFRHARQYTVGSTSFRLWKSGALVPNSPS